MREIEILKKCDSPYVISTHGAIYHQNKISIFLEFMDVGSLDAVLNVTNRVPERVLSRITRLVNTDEFNYLNIRNLRIFTNI